MSETKNKFPDVEKLPDGTLVGCFIDLGEPQICVLGLTDKKLEDKIRKDK